MGDIPSSGRSNAEISSGGCAGPLRDGPRVTEDWTMNGRMWKSGLRVWGAGLCGGSILAAGCADEQVRSAIAAGVQTTANRLADGSNNQNNDVSFLDWVNSELDD